MTSDLVDHLYGPHEWGYRDPVTGEFIKDNKPFEAADHIRELQALVQSINQIIDAKSEMFTSDTDVLESIKDRIRAAQP